jgi:hypothetical protein
MSRTYRAQPTEKRTERRPMTASEYAAFKRDLFVARCNRKQSTERRRPHAEFFDL